MKANIKKISEMTGYSMATVSNALTGNRGVSQEAENIILAAARKIGYLENNKISSVRYVILNKQKHIVDSVPHMGDILNGVEEEAQRLGYSLLVEIIDCTTEEGIARLQAIIHDRSAGSIFLATELDEADESLFDDAECPYILVGYGSSKKMLDTVNVSNFSAMYQNILYLHERGHEKIGYLRCDIRTYEFGQRETGFYSGMKAAGLSVNPPFIFDLPIKIGSSFERMNTILDQNPELPTAFVTDSDNIIAGVIKAFKNHGYRIPEDISLIGFGDTNYCQILQPELTSVHMHLITTGIQTMRRLNDIIVSPRFVKQNIQICTFLAERNSVMDISENR